MKRDMELARKVLLEIEAKGGLPNQPIRHFKIEGYDEEVVAHSVWLLKDGGFIEATVWSGMNTFDCLPICLTWRGAEFLDDVRDDEVWRKTKAGAQTMGGAGVSLMWEIAKAVAKAKVSDALGIAL